jgi:phosphate-selective porin OprO/OprP
MFKSQLRLSCAIGVLALLGAGSAHAQSAEQIDKMQAQINALQSQIAKLKGQVTTNEQHVKRAEQHAKNAEQHVDVAYTKAPAPVSTAIVDMSANNRPEICTPDKLNCIALTGRLHLDAGGYSYHPNSRFTSPQNLDDGVNARRARLGVVGKFAGDFNYYFVYDFGGSSDGFGSSVAGGATSGIENAYVSYTGLKPVAFEAGYMDTPFTLDEATSSNDIMFMERSSSQVIATNIAAGDNRFAAGIRGNTDRFWAGAYFTGPTSGSNHEFINGGTEQDGAFVRATYQLLQDENYSLHIGGGAEFLLRPSGTGVRTLTLSDRPELRIDPTTILSTGAISNVDGAQVYNAEAAGGIGPFFVQGEYFHYNIQRGDGFGDNEFDGGYVEASYTLTGEHRKYIPTAGAYSGISPKHPFDVHNPGDGWGAWEIAGRYSVVDLNDGFTAGQAINGTDAVAGGKQTVYTVGLNWYLNNNVRMMFNYLHGDIDKANGTSGTAVPLGADLGASFDAFATRLQVAF